MKAQINKAKFRRQDNEKRADITARAIVGQLNSKKMKDDGDIAKGMPVGPLRGKLTPTS